MTVYINSIQYFSITIPNGSASATTTITAVGALAFILFNGQNASSGTPSTGIARVTLTNSTTVTATRNASTTSTVTIKGCVVDATSSLINSIQFGTISLSNVQVSNTATISSVNTANTAVAFLGYTTGSGTLTGQNQFEVALTLTNSTTVTADKQTIGQTNVVSFCVIEFQGAALNQAVQQINDTNSPAGTSRTVTVTSVNTSNSMMIYGGAWSQTTSNATGLQRGVLTNGTTVTINTNTGPNASVNYKATLVEFVSGVLNQAAQRGTITYTGISSTATVTSVNTTNAALNYTGHTTNASSALNTGYANGVLTNSTTVTSNVDTSSTINYNWELVEFSTSGATPANSNFFMFM